MPERKTIDDYIEGCEEPVANLLKDLRAFIHNELPGATEGMQYGTPVFLNAQNAPVIYLFGSKAHLNFGFLRASEISDPEGALQGSGKPSMHIRLHPGQVFDTPLLRDFIKQCEALAP